MGNAASSSRRSPADEGVLPLVFAFFGYFWFKIWFKYIIYDFFLGQLWQASFADHPAAAATAAAADAKLHGGFQICHHLPLRHCLNKKDRLEFGAERIFKSSVK